MTVVESDSDSSSSGWAEDRKPGTKNGVSSVGCFAAFTILKMMNHLPNRCLKGNACFDAISFGFRIAGARGWFQTSNHVRCCRHATSAGVCVTEASAAWCKVDLTVGVQLGNTITCMNTCNKISIIYIYMYTYYNVYIHIHT